MGLHDVQIEGESLAIIKKLQSDKPDLSILSSIVADIKWKIGFFVSITFQHVRREVKVVVHVLVKEGSIFSKEQCWIEKAPDLVEKVVTMDRTKHCPLMLSGFCLIFSEKLHLSLL